MSCIVISSICTMKFNVCTKISLQQFRAWFNRDTSTTLLIVVKSVYMSYRNKNWPSVKTGRLLLLLILKSLNSYFLLVFFTVANYHWMDPFSQFHSPNCLWPHIPRAHGRQGSSLQWCKYFLHGNKQDFLVFSSRLGYICVCYRKRRYIEFWYI